MKSMLNIFVYTLAFIVFFGRKICVFFHRNKIDKSDKSDVIDVVANDNYKRHGVYMDDAEMYMRNRMLMSNLSLMTNYFKNVSEKNDERRQNELEKN